jgi:hypothetical protein
VVSDTSNHSHTNLFPIAFKYGTPKHGVENKVLDFYDDPEETLSGISQQIQNNSS